MIPLLVMLGIGIVSAVWPGPKVSTERHESGAIFSPRFRCPIDGLVISPEQEAPEDPYAKYTRLTADIESKRPE